MGTVSCLFPGVMLTAGVAAPAGLPGVTLMGAPVPLAGLPSAGPSDCQEVHVPGQQFWHTHVCEVCGSSWTHIAPTPMTQGMNKKIHTCTKCGTFCWKFIPVKRAPDVPLGWVAAGALAGVLLVNLLDRG